MSSKFIVQTLLGAIILMALFIGSCTSPALADGPYASGGQGTFDTDYYEGTMDGVRKYLSSQQPFCDLKMAAILADHGDAHVAWCGFDPEPDVELAYKIGNGTYSAGVVATHKVLTCSTVQHVKWPDENTAPVCENPQPNECSTKTGQAVTVTQQCGTVACAIGQTWTIGSDGKSSCSSGGKSGWPTATPHPSPIAMNGCEAIFDHTVGLSILKADAGKQSVPAYCNDQYTYTGQAANTSDGQPNQGANSGLTADTHDPGDGGCPAGTFHGTGPLGESCYGTPSDGANSGSPNGTGNSGGVPNGTGNSGGTGNNPDGTANSGAPDGTSNSGGTGGGAHGTSNSGCTDCSAGTVSKCENPPECSGDAVGCAILVQSWKNTCYMTSTPDDGQQGVASEAVNSGSKDYDTQKQAYSDGVKGIMDNFFQSANGHQYTGTCPPDISIPYVNGQSIVIRISQFCDVMRVFRMLLLAFAYLTAARIIFDSAL